MLNNSWFKKEKPILGLTGMGGGAAPLAGGGGEWDASGGWVTEWTEPGPGVVYRTHTFLDDGPYTFSVTNAPATATIDTLMIGGGGGGSPSPYDSPHSGGGAGGGGVIYAPGIPVTLGDYAIVVGRGGEPGTNGGNTTFGDPAAGTPWPADSLIALGGGTGGNNPNVPTTEYGGSGGGGRDGGEGVTGAQGADPNPMSLPVNSYTYGLGNPGGDGQDSAPAYAGGGGGSAAAQGGNAGANAPGEGGAGYGVPHDFLNPALAPSLGTPGPSPTNRYFAGGGSGGYRYSPASVGEAFAGGGKGDGQAASAQSGLAPTTSYENTTGGGIGGWHTGGGGGGSGNGNTGGNGGPGIMHIRYAITEEVKGTAKATGGMVNLWSNPDSPTGTTCVHVFTQPGTFITSSSIPSAEVWMVGGGGGGGFDAAGGGGGGGIIYAPTLAFPTSGGPGSNGQYPFTIGAGGAGGTSQPTKGVDGGTTSMAYSPTVPYMAGGGGGGGSRLSADGSGGNGSGGGGGREDGEGASSGPFGTGNPGFSEYANDGGNANDYGGGGGGAGNDGQPYDDGPYDGWGGIGKQAPAPFRVPYGQWGAKCQDGTSYYGFGGGGGAGGTGSSDDANMSDGGAYGAPYADPTGTVTRHPGGPYYGGGLGRADPTSETYAPWTLIANGGLNTGGGGGGGSNGPGGKAPQVPGAQGGQGGPGIAMISYPV